MNEEMTHRFSDDGLKLVLTRLDSIDGRLDSICTDLDSVKADLTSVKLRLDSMDSRLNSVEIRVSSIDIRLTELEEKVDRRLMETRPIWEQVLARLDNVESDVGGVRIDLSAFRLETSDRFDLLNEKFGAFNEDMLNLRAGHRRLDKRIDKIESERPQ